LYKTRIKKITEKLFENNIDGFVVNKPENQYYISGFSGEGLIIITGSEKIILLPIPDILNKQRTKHRVSKS